jgi:hypothetical protein
LPLALPSFRRPSPQYYDFKKPWISLMLDSAAQDIQHELSHSDPLRRVAAVRVHRHITADLMEIMLTDPAPCVRMAALWRLTVPITPAQLERALIDPDAGVRIRAIFRHESLTMAQINRAMNDPNTLVQQSAAIKRIRNR